MLIPSQREKKSKRGKKRKLPMHKSANFVQYNLVYIFENVFQYTSAKYYEIHSYMNIFTPLASSDSYSKTWFWTLFMPILYPVVLTIRYNTMSWVNDACFIFSLDDFNEDDFEDTKHVIRSHKSKKKKKGNIIEERKRTKGKQ